MTLKFYTQVLNFEEADNVKVKYIYLTSFVIYFYMRNNDTVSFTLLCSFY